MITEFVWISAGVLLSYLISYVSDLCEFTDKGTSLLPSVRRQAIPLFVSFVCRFIGTTMVFGLLHAIHTSLPLLSTSQFIFSVEVPIIAILSGVLVSGSGMYFTAWVRKVALDQAEVKKRWTPLISALLKAGNVSWMAFVKDVINQSAEDVCIILNDYKNDKWAILTLFEDRKVQVIDHAFRNAFKVNPRLWVYYGLTVGDNNSKKLEGLIHAIGLNTTKSELEALRSGKRKSNRKITTDLRTCPRELYRKIVSPGTSLDDIIEELTRSNRVAEQHISQIIQQDPAVLERLRTRDSAKVVVDLSS